MDWINLLGACGLFLTALTGVANMMFAVVDRREARASHQVTLKQSSDIHNLEISTNSMKDALVAATGKAEGLAGEERGRLKQEQKTDAVAAAVAAATTNPTS
jgi:serine phosphatase RsbU (regulator of sigma subunit)